MDDKDNNHSDGSHGDNLVRMANQIGTFFDSMPDRQEAVMGIATHLKKFWDPRMRKSLLAKVDDSAAQHGISDIVLRAISEHRAMLAPPPA